MTDSTNERMTTKRSHGQPNRVAAAEKGLPPVIMFAFDSYFPAVAATDLLVSRSIGSATRTRRNTHHWHVQNRDRQVVPEPVPVRSSQVKWPVRHGGAIGLDLPDWPTTSGCSSIFITRQCWSQRRLASLVVAYDCIKIKLVVTRRAPRSAALLLNPQVPVADILCCKPSELAFYPLPKLMIRRGGDHEAHSATRAVR